MFYFGIFSTHVPYLIMGLLYCLYYVTSLFVGNHTPIVNESALLNKEKTLTYEVSYKSQDKYPSTYKIAFEQTQAVIQTKEIIKVHFTSIKEQTPLLSNPMVDSKSCFALFSRPPPTSFLI